MCSERDITFDLGVCINGFQNKTYKWTESPNVKKCHDGISLPQTETIPCSNLICVPGKWQPPNSQVCVDTNAGKKNFILSLFFILYLNLKGYFSVGAASYFYDWSSVPNGFTLSCSDDLCTNWRPQGNVKKKKICFIILIAKGYRFWSWRFFSFS